MTFESIIKTADSLVWGWVLIVLILSVGVWLTIRTRFIQLRHLGLALKYAVKNEQGGVGEVSSFGALCTALSATIGTGNIVGVATAIVAGGPGALLWMLIAAFFGMATKYAEGVLAVKFRVKAPDGHLTGGPFWYIENGLGKKYIPLARLFAVFGALAGVLGIGTITQVNGIYEAAQNLFDREKKGLLFTLGGEKPFLSVTWTTIIVSVVVTLCAALVIIGGVKRMAKVSSIIVPFMAGTYILFALMILIACYQKLPAAVSLILRSAFDPSAAGGAISGLLLKTVIQKGVGRGIFSNEAGLGSAPIAAASAKTKEPVRQGLVTMTGTFIDTMVICTITGLSIIVTGAWNTGGGIDGAKVTAYAWQHGLPFDKNVSAFILMLCLAFFAFTTILGWNYYGERCLEYLTGSRRALRIYRRIYIGAVFFGSGLALDAVWGIADICNGLMAFPNLIALFLLSGVVSKETKNYFTRKKPPFPKGGAECRKRK